MAGAEGADAAAEVVIAAAEDVVTELVVAENRACAARCRGVYAMFQRHEDRVRARVTELGAGEPDWARLDPFDHACQSLVATTGVTYSRARDMVLLGAEVHEWAGPVLEAMESGLICERIAMLLCAKVRDVGADLCEEVIAAVVEDYLRRLRAGERPSRQAISRNAGRVVEQLDPEGAEERRRDAALTRSVRFRKDDDGMCAMSARLTSASGALLAERLDAFTGKATSSDTRTLAQRRADALVAMATGEHIVAPPASSTTSRAGSPSAAPSASPFASPDASPAASPAASSAAASSGGPVNVSPVLRPQITIIATGTGAPRLEFARTGESTMAALTRLLAEAQGATFELVDTRPGTVDRPGYATKYRISPELARRIRSRDGTCRHPGCAVHANDCDIDHIVPFDKSDPARGGLTAEENLMCLCRRHHRYKTFSKSRYEYVDQGRVRITIGRHVLTTDPTGPLGRARSRITTSPKSHDGTSGRPGGNPGSLGKNPGRPGENPGPPDKNSGRPGGGWAPSLGPPPPPPPPPIPDDEPPPF